MAGESVRPFFEQCFRLRLGFIESVSCFLVCAIYADNKGIVLWVFCKMRRISVRMRDTMVLRVQVLISKGVNEVLRQRNCTTRNEVTGSSLSTNLSIGATIAINN